MENFINKWLFDPTIGKIVSALIGIIIIWVIVTLIQKKLLSKIRSNEDRYKTKKFMSFFGFILIIGLITVVFSDKLGNITVALGVAGAGIAFALQEVIASIAGWMAIQFGGFYKAGDRVQLGGIKGDVIDIGIIRTTLLETGQWVDGDLYNGRIVRVANSFVFKEPVFNYSADFPFLWDEIKIPVQYGSNYKKFKVIVSEIAEKNLRVFADGAQKYWENMVKKYLIENASINPMVTMIANDNWVEYTLRYAVDFKKRRLTKDKLFSEIIEAVEKEDSGIKLASATFHLVQAPEFNVRLTNT